MESNQFTNRSLLLKESLDHPGGTCRLPSYRREYRCPESRDGKGGRESVFRKLKL